MVAFLGTTSISRAQLTANFTADTTWGCGSTGVIRFTDLSTSSGGAIVSWNWNFGNGSTSNLQNPQTSYSSPGTYTVQLTINDGSTSNTITKTNFITVYPKPTVNFSFSPTVGCVPLSTTFTSTASGGGGSAIQNYLWDFGDGAISASANPNHVYTSPGNPNPSLQVTDQNGCSSTKLSSTPVTIIASPVASFSSTTNINCTVPHTVDFSSTGSQGNALSYRWDFGDGGSSTLANPSHTYTVLGSYDVRLIITDGNSGCEDTLTMIDFVRVEAPDANFEILGDTFCIAQEIPFINQSIGKTFRWAFSDTSVSFSQVPEKYFLRSGTYYVTLTTATSGCIDRRVDSLYIQEVTANFTTTPTYFCQAGDTAYFTNTSVNADYYFWSIGRMADKPAKYQDENLKIPSGFTSGFLDDTLIAISRYGCIDTIVKDSNRQVNLLKASIGYGGAREFAKDTLGGCAPLSLSLIAGPVGPGAPYTYEWALEDGTILTDSIIFLTVPEDSSLSVSLIVRNTLGCIADKAITIIPGKRVLPHFDIKPDTICSTDTAYAIHDPVDTNIQGFVYTLKSLTGSDDIFGSDTPHFAFTVFPDTGLHRVKVKTSVFGCDTFKILDSALYVKGPIMGPIARTNVCEQPLTVNFLAQLKGHTDFIWDFGDGQTNSVDLNPQHTYGSQIIYEVILTAFNSQNGCDTVADTFHVDLRPRPALELRSSNYCAADSITFQLAGLTDFYQQFEWTIDGTISGLNDTLDTLFTDPGQHIVRIVTTDFQGCNDTLIDTVTIHAPQALFDTLILNGCLPASIVFRDTSIHTAPIHSYLWRFGNGDTSIQAMDTITFNQKGFKDVFLRIEDIYGCTDSILKKNYVNPEILTVDFSTGSPLTCTGKEVVFSQNVQGQNPTIYWDFGDGSPVVQSNTKIVTHTYTTPGLYTVKLTAVLPSGCSRSEIKQDVIEVQDFRADFTSDVTSGVCYPLLVTFSDQSVGQISDWQWSFGDQEFSTLPNPQHNYTLPGTYDVQLIVKTAFGCVDTILKTAYIVTNGPTASFSIDKEEACINETVNFTVNSSNNVSSFTWVFGDGNSASGTSASHAYDSTGLLIPSLVISDPSGNCTVSLPDSVRIYDVKAAFSVSDDSICAPGDVQIDNQSIGFNSFTWQFGQGNANPSELNPLVSYTSPGISQISLAISSSIGCLDTAYQNISVFPKPIPGIIRDTGICIGDTIQLRASGGVLYRWKPDTFLSDPLIPNPLAYPDTSINYTMITTSTEGCIDSLSTLIYVQQEPLQIALQDTNLIVGESLGLDLNAGQGFIYQWSPPEFLSCSDCPNPTIKPLESRTYWISITDAYGCFSLLDSIKIDVENLYSLDVPKAFSPNGDGVNDIIYVKGWGLKELLSFKIYNRFGELVFESTDFNKGWDGSYRGKIQDIETYVYTVEALTYGDKVLSKKGNISLLR
jgi:gliding motility-associated-like protein